MFSAFERLMAMRYLRARRQEGFISVIAGFSLLGIALGVATLIIVMAVMNGFRQELLGRVLGLNGHLNVYGAETALTDYDALAGRIGQLPGVVTVTPVVEGQALVQSQGNAAGAMVRGISIEALKSKPILSEKIVGGSLDAFTGDAVVIGARMAQRFGLRVGDQLTVVSPRGSATAFGTMPRFKAYPIVALFDVGMYEYDSGFVFMPLETAQTFFRLPQQVTTLEIMLADPSDPADERRAVAQAVAGKGRVFDWQQSNANFVNALQVERNVMFLILTLIILVAAFNIISSLIMLVKDKTRDIAIMRTMGATRGMVMRIFFLTGASIGVTGTIAGFVLGTVFSLNIENIRQGIQKLTGTDLFAAEIYFLSQLPAKLEWDDVLSVVGMALALSFAATIYPSWRAARLEPVEALRHE